MNRKKTSPAVWTSVVVVLCMCGYAPAQTVYNLKIPTSRCKLVNANQCFNDTSRDMNFTVGKEVSKLSDLYHFCTDIKVMAQGKPARIILTLDASKSMCEEVTGCNGASKNDPTDKRIDGANAFVDSVAGRCQTCEIGVIVYTGGGSTSPVAAAQTPLKVTGANVATLHQVINSAACSGGLGKTKEVGNLTKTAKTYTGVALENAIKMVDAGFDTLSGMDRHIILLTDGDWQTPTTREILDAYAAAYPNRKIPTIHGVFLSDSVAHVAAGFPQYGLLTCSATDSVPMDMQYLKLAASETGGKYIPGSTPQTIVSTFQELFKVIVDTSRIGLASVIFTNKNTGEQRVATFERDTAYPLGGHFIVHVPAFDLAIGSNIFVITWVTQDSTGFRKTASDTFAINRQTTVGTGTTEVFKTECGADSVDLSITCRPPTVPMSEFDTVRAAIDPDDVSIFLPNNITVRAFTPFPDEKNDHVFFLFHLDDNKLVNSAAGGQPGTGSPTITAGGGAFGGCVSAGAFTSPSVMNLSGNFCFECWIKPTAATFGAAIAGAEGFNFGLKNGYLTVTVGAKTITTNHAVDTDVWQHVAVSRINGGTNIYINGIPMAQQAATTETISGVFTIGNKNGQLLLDEARLSTATSAAQLFGQTLVEIPTAAGITWKINNTTSSGPAAVLPPEMWQGGRLSFLFTRSAPGPVIVNFFDTVAGGQLMWSKNGEPVLFATEGIPVTATLLDTSHDGHLDRIDLSWTEAITVKTPLPAVSELTGNLVITTLDGKTITLQAVTAVFDPGTGTVHIILNQTAGTTMETGFQNPLVTIRNVPATTGAEPFVVTKIVDGASPIPVSACYAPAEAFDTLKLTFSEPIASADSLNSRNFLRVAGDNSDSPTLYSFNPVSDKLDGDKRTWIIVFPYDAKKGHAVSAYDYRIQETFSTGPRSPKVGIDYCYPVSLIERVKVGPNPYVESHGITNGPTVTYPEGSGLSPERIAGQKIEIRLKRPVIGPSGKQEVQGWLTVFDAVGNVLVKDKPLGMESPTVLSTGWNYVNRKGMKVAGGTYLGRYVVKHIIDGVTVTEERGKCLMGKRTVK